MSRAKKSKPFSVRLREAREKTVPDALGRKKKLTRSEMGALLGCTGNHIARIEDERSEPSPMIERTLAYTLAIVEAGIDPFSVR